jgi:hypothetical protein
MGLRDGLLTKIRQYLDGKIAMRELYVWLVEETPGLYDSGESPTIRLTDQVWSAMSGYSDGVLNEQEVRLRLALLLRGYRVIIVVLDANVIATTGHRWQTANTAFGQHKRAVVGYGSTLAGTIAQVGDTFIGGSHVGTASFTYPEMFRSAEWVPAR